MLPETTNWSLLPDGFPRNVPITSELMKDYQVLTGGVWLGGSDLYYAVYATLALIFIRLLVERFIAKPLARLGGISDVKRTPPVANEMLDQAYKSSRKCPKDGKQLAVLVKSSGMKSEREVQRWYRRKQNEHMPTKMVKFQEGFWRGLFYTAACIYGVWALKDELYLNDTSHAWIGYPFHTLTSKVQWYYFIKLGFYASLSITGMLFDVKRKDFWEMQLHHFTTALLMTFSYTSGMHRIGALILLVHDVSDIFLEYAKGTNYIWEGSAATSIFFAVFAVMFLICRLVVYPAYMIKQTLVHSEQDFCHRSWYSLDFMGVLLSILLCLHVFWMYLITNILIKAVTGGAIQDSREEADSEEDGGVEDKKGK